MVPKSPQLLRGCGFVTEPREGGWAAYLLQSSLPIPLHSRMFGLLSSNPLLGEPGSLTELPPSLSYLPTYSPTHWVLAGSRQGCTAEQVSVGGSSHPSLLCKGLAQFSELAWQLSLPAPDRLPSEPGSGWLPSRTPPPPPPQVLATPVGGGGELWRGWALQKSP